MTQHWLIKTEPEMYSIDDLQRDGKTAWEGVRNYQARNYMRDGMKVGDLLLFYHSVSDPGIRGIAKVCKPAHADESALNPKDKDHFDPKSTKENPIWLCVDVQFVEKFPRVISLTELKAQKNLAGMVLLQRGSRLSVMPVSKEHFDAVVALAKK